MATCPKLNTFVDENRCSQEVLDPVPHEDFHVPLFEPESLPNDDSSLHCTIERIVFQSPTTGYCVLKVRAKGYACLVTAIGSVVDAQLGMEIQAWGKWINDSRYGRQFKIQGWETALPTTLTGIEKFLASDLFEGIGPKLAQAIVNAFGLDTFNILDNEPDRLSDIEGLGPTRIKTILESWRKNRILREVMVFLRGHGVGESHAMKIWERYQDRTIDLVSKNPYRLADEIEGIGFKTADGIASHLGFSGSNPFRCESGIRYTLKQMAAQGHVYATSSQLIVEATKLLNVSKHASQQAIEVMSSNKTLIQENDCIYLPSYYFDEINVAKRLLEICGCSTTSQNRAVPIAQIENETGIFYDQIQIEAMTVAIRSKVMVLTGGPGTGKTTTLQGILSAFQILGLEVLLAAPTGRAAKRLHESTKEEAKTIHRLIEFNPKEGFMRNRMNPLEGDVLILDECSMIDIALMHDLLKAVPISMRLILVGDIDQLPSVGAGNVLRDIISSNVVPVVRLTRIFRQAQTSDIILSSHRINQGKVPEFLPEKESDFRFIEEGNPESAAQTIVDLVQNEIPTRLGISSNSIQVLAPMHKSPVGTNYLNQVLQQALNPGDTGVKHGDVFFRVNDRVMQIRNDYKKKVFNGDIGTVCDINIEKGTLTVWFEDCIVDYKNHELNDLVHAYAITIHKSQGSEFPVVVMPLLMTHLMMLQRNLVYTGITRAKNYCVIVGEKAALERAVRNVPVQLRNTKLVERLTQQKLVQSSLQA